MSEKTNEHIAKQIKTVRKMKGLSLIDFAKRLDTTKPMISMLESNKIQCSEETINRICEEFKVNRAWFTPK